MLRHLRKVLLLLAIPHHPEAVLACLHLAALPTVQPTRRAQHIKEIQRQHDDEHGQVGVSVKLTLDDLERLHLLLQTPHGGNMDDMSLRLGEYIWNSLRGMPPPPMAELPLEEVEEFLRCHLELDFTSAAEETKSDDDPTHGMARLSLDDKECPPPPPSAQKELAYTRLRGTTILLKPNSVETSSGASTSSEPHFVGNLASTQRLHDLLISDCSDAHFYLLHPFEHATISACTGCTIVVGAVAGLLHVVDCEKTCITTASRRILLSNSADTIMYVFTPTPPLLVGDNRSCQFAPYNTYYDGLREDLLATGLAVAVVPENQSPYHGARHLENDAAWPPLQCASNKWKQPIELAKLEMPTVPTSTSGSPPTTPASSSPGADDKAMKAGTNNDTPVHAPILLPSSEYHILFIPVESDAQRQRRAEQDEADESNAMESQYCKILAETLQLSPFRLPTEYERRILVKADRMRTIQQAVQKNLTPEQQSRFEEEINRGFRDWLVTSGNLRQVLDLVHLERRGGV
jgi:Tubulin binding cofactor C